MSPRTRLRTRRRAASRTTWARYFFGRMLQVAGLVLTLVVAASALFGTPATSVLLTTLLIGVAFFIPGRLLTRRDPRQG